MNIPVLLVSTATHWTGTARVPSALAKAGFDVALLAPRGSLAEKSRFVSKLGVLPENATVPQWVAAFAGAVKATAPRIAVPCDDMAFRLLDMLVRSPPPELQPALQSQLAALISESMGDSAWYSATVDTTRLPSVAEAAGIRVPPFTAVTDPAAAESFAARHGFPVMLKRAHGFAARGIAMCADRNELTHFFEELSRFQPLDPGHSGPAQFLVQARVRGRLQHYLATAWQGELLAGYASENIIADPDARGPPAVSRHFRAPRLREIAESLAASFGISGHFSVEFIVPDGCDAPLVWELNRRITPGSHRGRALNVDQWAALHARLDGTSCRSRTDLDDGEEGLTVWFPEEWLRDPESRYLREQAVDVPWDEPELIEAFLAMRHGK